MTDRYKVRFSCPSCHTAGAAAIEEDDRSAYVYNTTLLIPGFYITYRQDDVFCKPVFRCISCDVEAGTNYVI